MEVSHEDVLEVIRLVREVCDRWDDPRNWRECLLRGACQLINGHVGTIMADYDAQHGWFGDLTVIAAVGIPKPMEEPYRNTVAQQGQRRFEEVAQSNPGLGLIVQTVRRQGWATMAGSQIAASVASENVNQLLTEPSDLQDLRQKMDCDDYVVSIRIVDMPRRPEAITIERPQGAAPFSDREISLLRLLHDEIAPLIGVRLTTEEHISRDGLSKRLRETLSLLLEGYSEKQVAHELKLGVPTIHDYVTMLYQHFQVSSRAELLAYFIRRTPMPRSQHLDINAVI